MSAFGKFSIPTAFYRATKGATTAGFEVRSGWVISFAPVLRQAVAGKSENEALLRLGVSGWHVDVVQRRPTVTWPYPAPGSIVTLRRPVLADEGGHELEVGLDVVVLEVCGDEHIRVSAETKSGEDVEAHLDEGDWYQRPEERR